eukprot:COSAG04_NODE_24862_length_315_cov_140.652778_1_plen_30_part_10
MYLPTPHTMQLLANALPTTDEYLPGPHKVQ